MFGCIQTSQTGGHLYSDTSPMVSVLTNASFFLQLGDRVTSLMTGSPPLYSYRRPRIGNATGLFINQAQIVVPDIPARSYRGDQQVCPKLKFALSWDSNPRLCATIFVFQISDHYFCGYFCRKGTVPLAIETRTR